MVSMQLTRFLLVDIYQLNDHTYTRVFDEWQHYGLIDTTDQRPWPMFSKSLIGFRSVWQSHFD